VNSESKHSGGEGEIRTQDRLESSVSFRFYIAHDAKLATDAVDYCTLLHAATALHYAL
jgi:hypothetical protein